MLIHSVLPPKLSIAGLETSEMTMEKTIEGVKVLVEPAEGHSMKITRILSTNPYDFLNPKLQPGRYLSYTFK